MWGLKSTGIVPFVWVKDACKVLGHGFNLKWVIGATKEVMDNGIAVLQNTSSI
jgi:hypothetical protein